MKKKADWRAAVAMATGPADLALSLLRQMIFLLSFCLSSFHSHPCGVGVLREKRVFLPFPSWPPSCCLRRPSCCWAPSSFLPALQNHPADAHALFFFFFLDFSCCSAGSTASTVNERLSFASLSVAHSHSHSLWWPSLWPHSKYSKALHLHFIIVHYLNYFKHKYISHTVWVM